MRSNAVWMAGLVALVALAGCTDDATPSDSDDVDLDAGKGAIAGLLVDDRFRPLHLTDDPTSEFQAAGFVLLQETGEQIETNEDGEFTFVNVEPGSYTIRVSAGGHEVSPQTVQVDEGEFSELTVIAQRVISEEGVIIVQEYAIFAPCGADALVVGVVGSTCTPDGSGDSNRFSFTTNYTDFGANVSFLVSEVLVNQVGDYTLVIRQPGDTAFGGGYYLEALMRETDYIKVVNQYGKVNEEHDQRGNIPWENDSPMDNILFYDGMYKDDLYGAYDGEATCTQDPGVPQGGLIQDRSCRGFSGVGARLGIQAQFIQSLFIGEPEEDVATYCLLCE